MFVTRRRQRERVYTTQSREGRHKQVIAVGQRQPSPGEGFVHGGTGNEGVSDRDRRLSPDKPLQQIGGSYSHSRVVRGRTVMAVAARIVGRGEGKRPDCVNSSVLVSGGNGLGVGLLDKNEQGYK